MIPELVHANTLFPLVQILFSVLHSPLFQTDKFDIILIVASYKHLNIAAKVSIFFVVVSLTEETTRGSAQQRIH